MNVDTRVASRLVDIRRVERLIGEEIHWVKYFANPSKWWDNRDCKWNSKSSNFKHKVTFESLWIDGYYTLD